MSTARILIITNGPLARNPRVVKEATTLGAAGHAVTVLGIRNHASSIPLDETIAANAPFAHRWVNVLRDPNASLPTRIGAWSLRLRTRVARDASLHCHLPTVHSLGPASALLREARRYPADLVIAHNEISHWIAARLIAEGRRVAADIEDWHSEDLLPAERSGRPLDLLRSVERTLLHKAAYVTTTSEALSTALHQRHGGHAPSVISNSFPLQSDPRTSTPFDPSAPPSFFWFSQTTGPGRGLELFLAAWSKVKAPSRVVLLGEPRSGYDRHLLGSLAEHLRSRLTFLPLVPPGELPSLIARHDIGLALEQPFIVNRDLTITNKILQYLGAGLAVLASDTAGQREVLAHDPHAGLVVPLHETTALTHTLERMLNDRDGLRSRQHAARRLAANVYSWEREAPKLLNLVERALG